ncbi:MAG: UrcA family protein [Henriciella sp.]
MTLSKTMTTIIAAATACAVLPAMAATQFDAEEKSKEISIAGYDLTQATDAKAILARIESAAKSVCKVDANRQTVRETMLRRECEKAAIESTVESLDAPEIAALIQN